MSRAQLFNISEFQSDKFDSNPKTIDNKGKNNDGGSSMNKDYVTHEELNHAIDHLSDKLDLMEAHIDNKFEQVNTKFEQVNTKFEQVNTKFEQVNTKFATQKVWFYGTAISIILATLTIVKFIH
ncbi:hypothetical protein [Lactobacillus fermentum] [Lactiplantibacillus mudanjiangensis]|uniref:hypothetical protein n=1 Tax=Lactiplantibacillus mudanjiangensis TaxID=1296538 RepID=UPI0010147E4B|nr:hypothetical protein [Lactiplantibacillus mudanjiangensis]VDG31510.1 hypothetical protein [Lactobacillus fermentum] [Lactiplantibacillus mudanjiangensis]